MFENPRILIFSAATMNPRVDLPVVGKGYGSRKIEEYLGKNSQPNR